jgi:cyanophycinase
MVETDRNLLATLGGPHTARVALMPTASGREPGSPRRWNEMGLRHFGALGVRDVRPVEIFDRAGAEDPAHVAQLADANFIYFSGGDPSYLIEALRGTAAWAAIEHARAAGAVLAGCSAGAMALGAYTLSLRAAREGGRVEPILAWAVVPGVVVFPHFDRMAGFVGHDWLDRALGALPAGVVPLGIDEDTALVQIDAARRRWRVMGRQAVHLLTNGAAGQVLRAGDEVELR